MASGTGYGPGGSLAALQGYDIDLHQPCPIVALGIAQISLAVNDILRPGYDLVGGPQTLAD